MAAEPRCRVIEPRESSSPDPLEVRQGSAVSVGERDSQWPGFLRCTAADGKRGWIAEEYLEIRDSSALLRRDYSANELTVNENELLKILDAAGGWFWCENASGERGWVPALNVRLVTGSL